ncbi:MAG TPA: radical SAM protein [Candidatus Omnitrophota bacterium]|nr:radical SAM protein [Candidatus Omnitrophota bacterium]HPS37316.1 radical SAM protein [Candidatus Omnitrophota bacterium]
MKKVLLYNPRERTNLRIPYLPFSLMTIGSALEKEGFSVQIIDARIEKDSHAQIREALREDILFFGVTLITGSGIYDALEAAEIVKKYDPRIPTIFGGVHASLLPGETVRNPLIDIVVIGPGEITAPKLAHAFTCQEPIDTVEGIAFKKDNHVVIRPAAAGQPETAFAPIDYRLVPLGRYLKKDATGDRCLDYLSSRGCPHPCTYCAISKIWKKKIFFYSAEKILEDLESFVRDHRIDSIHFLDDNFFVNRQRVESFCDKILAKGLKIRIWSMCRIQYFSGYDDAFLEKLKKAGFCTLNFGAESGSQMILDRIKKGHAVEEILRTAQKCHQMGFRGQFSFMMGFPFEQPSDLEKTMHLIETLHGIDPSFDLQLFPFTPFPQTDLAEECVHHGYCPPSRLEDWARFEYGGIKMPWLSKTLRKKIDVLTSIAWFGFTSETAIKLGGWRGCVFQFFGKIARWRWRKRFFGFPLEWKLINFFTRGH